MVRCASISPGPSGGADVNTERVFGAIERLALAAREARTPASLLDQACRAVADGFGFDRVVAATFESADGELRVVAVHGVGDELRGTIVPAGNASSDGVIEDGEAVFVADVVETGLIPPRVAASSVITSAFALPLVVRDRCLGWIAGDRGGAQFTMSSGSKRALRALGETVATFLQLALAEEERRRLDAVRTTFVANASHELRSPVTVVFGITSTIAAHGDRLRPEQLTDMGRILHEQATRLRFLVEQLLDLSRLDAEAVPPAPTRLRVRDRIEQLILVLAGDRSGDVEVRLSRSLEADLDPDALDRVFSNLLWNALKYGRPPIVVRAKQREGEFRLSVDDAGPGVPREFAEHLFDRFSRGDRTRDGTSGSGLGLAIARSYAQASGGDILYTPRRPQGAHFELVVPQLRSA